MDEAPLDPKKRKSGWKKARQVIEWTFICLLLAFDVFVMTMRFSSSSSGATRFFGNEVYVVLTGSMEGSDEFYAEHPEYEIKACPIDSALFVKNAPEVILEEDEADPEKVASKQAALDAFYQDVKVGDILTFYYQIGQTVVVTHRVIDINVFEGKYGNVYNFTLRGDNPSGDKVVSAYSPTQTANSTTGMIIGKVVGVNEGLGKFLTHFVGNKALMGVLLIGPTTILFLFEIGKIVYIVIMDHRETHKSKTELELEELKKKMDLQEEKPKEEEGDEKIRKLRVYKQMFDEGLISQEEYDKKKAELLES